MRLERPLDNGIAAGLKYNFVSIPQSEILMTGGLRYEVTTNDDSVLGSRLTVDAVVHF